MAEYNLDLGLLVAGVSGAALLDGSSDVSGAAPLPRLSSALECNVLGTFRYFEALLVHSGTYRYFEIHG